MKKIVLSLVFACFAVASSFSMAGPPPGGEAMPGAGIMTFLPLVAIVVILLLVSLAGKGRSSSSLVLKEFRLNENEDEFFRISGRASGILNWILSKCGINPITSLSCNKQAIKFEETAVRYGKKTLNIPLVAVTGVSSGVYKPFGLLVLGVVIIFAGIVGAFSPAGVTSFVSGLIIGVIFIVLYSLRKLMLFRIFAGGDKPLVSIYVKKSIIEGQDIDELKYEQASNALNKAVLKIHVMLANAQRQNNGT